MADRCRARVTIDDGIVDLRVGHSRDREGGGRQHDLVVVLAVVGIVGLRRHVPFGAVDRLAVLADLVVEAPARRIQRILAAGGAADDERRVVLPLVGIAHLGRDRGQLELRPSPSSPDPSTRACRCARGRRCGSPRRARRSAAGSRAGSTRGRRPCRAACRSPHPRPAARASSAAVAPSCPTAPGHRTGSSRPRTAGSASSA